MADQILSEIINDAMDQRQKAEAIYNWVRGNIRYSGASATRDWVQEATRASGCGGATALLIILYPSCF